LLLCRGAGIAKEGAMQMFETMGIVLGMLSLLAGIVFAFLDPPLAVPLAIAGTGLFVGGAVLTSKKG
jgi:hypothetical protein